MMDRDTKLIAILRRQYWIYIHFDNYPKLTDSYLFVILWNSEKVLFTGTKNLFEFVWEYMQING